MVVVVLGSAVEKAWRSQIAFFVKLVRRLANDLGVREGCCFMFHEKNAQIASSQRQGRQEKLCESL